MFDILKEILFSEKEVTDTNYEKLKKSNELFRNNFKDSDGFDV